MKPKDFFSHWNQVRTESIATITSFDNQELTYTPYSGSWSVGKIMVHIADAEDGWLRYVITRELDKWPKHYTLKNYPDKQAILQTLAEVHARTTAYLETLEVVDLSEIVNTPWNKDLPLLWIIWHVIEHEIHHRGELSLILGTLGREGLDV